MLGQLAFQSKRYEEARRYLSAFVKRTNESRQPMRIALAGELAKAQALLQHLDAS